MRRLVLVLAVFNLALLCASGAGAATKKPWPMIVEGAAHVSGTKVEGWFFVKNTAMERTRRAKVYTGVSEPRGSTFLGYRTAPSLRPGNRHRMRFSYQLPKGLDAGARPITLCTGRKCLHAGTSRSPTPA